MKNRIIYRCRVCKAEFPRWQGKCPSCNEWNSIEMIKSETLHRDINNKKLEVLNTYPISSIIIPEQPRIITNIFEFDRTIGGGIVPGSVILLAGDPGIGKSTFLLQILDRFKLKSIYISGEESPEQIKIRSERLRVNSSLIEIANETEVEKIEQIIAYHEARIIVIDSIQTIYSNQINSPPGSILQVRECTHNLMKITKANNKILLIIGHVNKEGNIAGPKALEHIVDIVLLLEGDKNTNIRILRTLKNRYGTTLEIGIFEMTNLGLIEIRDVEKIFQSHTSVDLPGVSLVPIMEATRCLIFEIQTLVSSSNYSVPQRNINGYDFKRLQTILAVLDRKLNFSMRNNDIFVNVAGGVFIEDTGLDLGLAMALISSWREIPIGSKVAIFGEIGLTGEVRNVTFPEKRLTEAANLGFKKVILPKASLPLISKKFDMDLVFVNHIKEAIDILF